MEKALGRELPASAENRPRQELEQQNQRQVRSTKDAVVDALSQTSPDSPGMPLNLIKDACVPNEDSTSLKTLVEEVKITFIISRKQ